MVPDEFAGEADQDRRQGGQPRPLRLVPDGRGRGAATNVPPHPAADRPTVGAADASMRAAVTATGAMNGNPRVPASPGVRSDAPTVIGAGCA